MIKEDNIKKVVAICFVVVLFIGFVKDGSYIEMQRLAEYLRQDVNMLDADGALTVDNLESEFSPTLWNQHELINLNGTMARVLNMQGFYSDIGIYITDEKYIVSSYDYTTTDYEYDEIVAFNAFLEDNGINLLYVNEPTKYTDDDLFSEEFGVETYSNRNMDTFISRIRTAGINTIDLRDNINQEGLKVSDLFYRTDHHWTTRAGLWATQIIAKGLNEYCGYNIDTSIYDETNYTFTYWSECWIEYNKLRKLKKA